MVSPDYPMDNESNSMNTDCSSGKNTVLRDEKTQHEKPRVSYLAVASLGSIIVATLCLVSVFFTDLDVFGQVATMLLPAGFVLGIIAAFVISRHKHLRGYGYVITPIVIGGGFILMMGMAELRLRTHAYGERTYTAVYNLKHLREIMIEYAKHNNGYLPGSDKWCDVLTGYDKSLSPSDFKHPQIIGRSIGFNENLAGKRLVDIPGDVVLLFEANGDWNLVGNEELLRKQKNDLGYFVHTVLVNGGVKNYWLDPNTHSTTEKHLRWKP